MLRNNKVHVHTNTIFSHAHARIKNWDTGSPPQSKALKLGHLLGHGFKLGHRPRELAIAPFAAAPRAPLEAPPPCDLQTSRHPVGRRLVLLRSVYAEPQENF